MDTLVSLALINLVTCVFATAIVLASWRFRPAIWAADLGLPRQDPVAGAVVLVVLVLVILGGSIASALVAVDEYGLVGAGIASWAVMVIFGLWDFLVIDWWIFIRRKPSWFHVEGMEKSTFIYDWRHHAKESIPSVVIGLPMAAISTGVAAFAT